MPLRRDPQGQLQVVGPQASRALPQIALIGVRLELFCAEEGLPMPTREYPVAPDRRWRFDYAWPAERVALEVDGGTWIGGRHSRALGFERDCRKLNQAAAAGWRVLRVTPGMLERDWPEVAKVLRQAFALRGAHVGV
jgi:hypothetical protein